MGAQVVSFVTIILMLLCVGFLAYIMTRFVGKKSMNVMKSKYMRVVDSLSIGFDRTIYLIKVGEEYILVNTSVKGFDFICTVSPEKIQERDGTENDNKKNFNKYFDFFKMEDKTENVESNKVRSNIDRIRNAFNNKK